MSTSDAEFPKLETDGSIKVGTERHLLMPLLEYENILNVIQHFSPEIVRTVVYESAYKTGLIIAQKLAPKVGDSRRCFALLVQDFTDSGAGLLEIVSFEPDTARGTVKGKNLALAGRAGRLNLFKGPQVVDDNCAGRLAGFASGIVGRVVTCEELYCSARGDSHCEFVLRPKIGMELGSA